MNLKKLNHELIIFFKCCISGIQSASSDLLTKPDSWTDFWEMKNPLYVHLPICGTVYLTYFNYFL